MLCFTYKNNYVQASISVPSKREGNIHTTSFIFSSLNLLHLIMADSPCTLQISNTKGKSGDERNLSLFGSTFHLLEGASHFLRQHFIPDESKDISNDFAWSSSSPAAVFETGRSRCSLNYIIYFSLDLFIICLQYNNIYLEKSKSDLWWKARALLDYCMQLYQISFLLKEMPFNFH